MFRIPLWGDGGKIQNHVGIESIEPGPALLCWGCCLCSSGWKAPAVRLRQSNAIGPDRDRGPAHLSEDHAASVKPKLYYVQTYQVEFIM